MGYAMVQARFQRDSALPEDVSINTFHFTTPTSGEVTAAEGDVLSQAVQDVWNLTWAPSVNPLRTYMAGTLATTGHQIRVYDMESPIPRVPVFQESWAMTPGAGGLPAEVALCGSFRGALVSGTNPARRRGRIYLGPLSTSAAAVTDLKDIRPNTDLGLTLVRSLYGSLVTALTAGYDWVVASQPGGVGDVTLTPVVAVWVDNAFDTQRRRGGAPDFRWTLP